MALTALLFKLTLFLQTSVGGSTATEWFYQDADYRIPIYVFARPEPRHPLDAAFLRIPLPSSFTTCQLHNPSTFPRAVFLDPDTDMKIPLETKVDSLTVEESSFLLLRGPMSIPPSPAPPRAAWKYATHPRINPAIASDGKTILMAYVSQAQTGEKNLAHGISVLAFCCETRQFSGPVSISILESHPREEANEHRAPAILIDQAGHAHVVYGAHGGHGKLRHRRALVPGNILDGWSEEVVITEDATTYPNFLEDEDGRLLVFARRTQASQLGLSLYPSTDGGQTWASGFPVITPGARGVYPAVVRSDPQRQTLHLLWSWWDRLEGSFADGFLDVVHAFSDDGGKSWKRMDGVELGESLTPPESPGARQHFLPAATGRKLVAYDIAVDDLGNPHIVYGAYEDARPLFYASWNGNQWITQTVGSGGYHSASIRMAPCGRLQVLAPTAGVSPSELHLFAKSTETDASWSMDAVMTQPPGRFSAPKFVTSNADLPIAAFGTLSSGPEEQNPIFWIPTEPIPTAAATIHLYFNQTVPGQWQESSPQAPTSTGEPSPQNLYFIFGPRQSRIP